MAFRLLPHPESIMEKILYKNQSHSFDYQTCCEFQGSPWPSAGLPALCSALVRHPGVLWAALGFPGQETHGYIHWKECREGPQGQQRVENTWAWRRVWQPVEEKAQKDLTNVYKNLMEGVRTTVKLFSREPRERTRGNGLKYWNTENSTLNHNPNNKKRTWLLFLWGWWNSSLESAKSTSLEILKTYLAWSQTPALHNPALTMGVNCLISSLNCSLICNSDKTPLTPEDPATTCSGLTSTEVHLNVRLCNKTLICYCSSILAFQMQNYPKFLHST